MRSKRGEMAEPADVGELKHSTVPAEDLPAKGAPLVGGKLRIFGNQSLGVFSGCFGHGPIALQVGDP